MSHQLLHIQGLSLHLEGNILWQDLSFSLCQGELLALTGSSGVGKSSLLAALPGLLQEWVPTAKITGEIWVPDAKGTLTLLTQIQDRFALRRRVHLVPQHPSWLPGSLFANLYLPRRYHFGESRKQAMEKIVHALEQVHLWQEVSTRLEQPVLAFSGGQQQRATLARALLLEPQVLLLDEPASGLDANNREYLYALLAQMRTDHALVVVSHHGEELRPIQTQGLHLA